MKKVLQVINSIILSLILTLITVTTSFLFMIFSVKEGKKTTYFNSIFFEVKKEKGGETALAFGVENVIPIIITFVVLAIIIFCIFSLVQKRKEKND